jgi:hypothetical protein
MILVIAMFAPVVGHPSLRRSKESRPTGDVDDVDNTVTRRGKDDATCNLSKNNGAGVAES